VFLKGEFNLSEAIFRRIFFPPEYHHLETAAEISGIFGGTNFRTNCPEYFSKYEVSLQQLPCVDIRCNPAGLFLSTS
jgi:hypothetical protein